METSNAEGDYISSANPAVGHRAAAGQNLIIRCGRSPEGSCAQQGTTEIEFQAASSLI